MSAETTPLLLDGRHNAMSTTRNASPLIGPGDRLYKLEPSVTDDDTGTATRAIYTASRTRHAAIWRRARRGGVSINSTWIDEAGEGETASMGDLWERCVDEARSSNALILYRVGDEPLKGALIEAGAALGAGKPVFAVGFDASEDLKTFSFLHHRLVTRCGSLREAFLLADGGPVTVAEGGE